MATDIEGIISGWWTTISDLGATCPDHPMVKVLEEFINKHNNEYYALLSDFYIDKIFPKYILNVIKKEYEQKSKADKVLVEYLTVLENTFTDLKSLAEIKE